MQTGCSEDESRDQAVIEEELGESGEESWKFKWEAASPSRNSLALQPHPNLTSNPRATGLLTDDSVGLACLQRSKGLQVGVLFSSQRAREVVWRNERYHLRYMCLIYTGQLISAGGRTYEHVRTR